MSKRKICFVCPWMHNDGGLQRVVSNLANRIAQEYEVVLCVVSITVKKPYYPLDDRIKVDFLPEAALGRKENRGRVLRKIFNYIELPVFHSWIKKLYYSDRRVNVLEQYLAERDFDYVIASCGDLSMLLAGVTKWKPQVKFIGWEHNSFRAYFEKRGKYYYGRKWLAGQLFQNLDEVVCLTARDSRVYGEQFGIASRYIYNPLSFQCSRKTDPANRRLIFVGRLDWEQKGLEFLADILEKFFKDNRSAGWEAIIVGDGEGRNRLEEEIKKAGLWDRVKMTGKSADVIQYFLQASICLNTSKWEGFGLVITEAMECGLPVVAFSTDGPMEIITDGKDGYIVSDYDVDAYAERLLELSENLELRTRMSQNAAAKAEIFSADKILAQWKMMLSQPEERMECIQEK